MLELAMTIVSFLKAFFPWIVAGVSTLIVMISRAQVKKTRKVADSMARRARRAEETAKFHSDLAQTLIDIDKKHDNERRKVISNASSSRDYFE